MKNQTNRMLIMFIIVGFVLLGIGCTTDTSQNNQNISNQNTADENASNVAESSGQETPPICTSVNETMIKNAVGDFGNYITYNDSTKLKVNCKRTNIC